MEVYSDYIMEALRGRRGLDADDDSQDGKIMAMSKRRAFDEAVAWYYGNGNGPEIRSYLEDIWGEDWKQLESR